MEFHLIHVADNCKSKGPGCCKKKCYSRCGRCWCDKACWFYRDCCRDVQCRSKLKNSLCAIMSNFALWMVMIHESRMYDCRA